MENKQQYNSINYQRSHSQRIFRNGSIPVLDIENIVAQKYVEKMVLTVQGGEPNFQVQESKLKGGCRLPGQKQQEYYTVIQKCLNDEIEKDITCNNNCFPQRNIRPVGRSSIDQLVRKQSGLSHRDASTNNKNYQEYQDLPFKRQSSQRNLYQSQGSQTCYQSKISKGEKQQSEDKEVDKNKDGITLHKYFDQIEKQQQKQKGKCECAEGYKINLKIKALKKVLTYEKLTNFTDNDHKSTAVRNLSHMLKPKVSINYQNFYKAFEIGSQRGEVLENKAQQIRNQIQRSNSQFIQTTQKLGPIEVAKRSECLFKKRLSIIQLKQEKEKQVESQPLTKSTRQINNKLAFNKLPQQQQNINKTAQLSSQKSTFIDYVKMLQIRKLKLPQRTYEKQMKEQIDREKNEPNLRKFQNLFSINITAINQFNQRFTPSKLSSQLSTTEEQIITINNKKPYINFQRGKKQQPSPQTNSQSLNLKSQEQKLGIDNIEVQSNNTTHNEEEFIPRYDESKKLPDKYFNMQSRNKAPYHQYSQIL